MGIKCSDLVSNAKVLRRVNLKSVKATIAALLRWLGHVARKNNSRLLNIIVYG